MAQLVDNHWNYSKNARYYKYRPNYSPKALDIISNYIKNNKEQNFKVADIGAGTGNLTLMLAQRDFSVDAVEPNDEMRTIGIETINTDKVNWYKAGGTDTKLESNKYDWVTFGSSFNVMNRELALKEAHRLLKDEGFFSCMWNHRNLNCPIQEKAENIIIDFVPNYSRGVRREDQKPFLEKYNSLFTDIIYLEVDFNVKRTIDEYINAWKSVRNQYWDLETSEGSELFEKITVKMRENLPESFEIRYTTRIWTAQKV